MKDVIINTSVLPCTLKVGLFSTGLDIDLVIVKIELSNYLILRILFDPACL